MPLLTIAMLALDQQAFAQKDGYDEKPDIETPYLIKPEHNFNKDDISTYAVYGGFRTVAEPYDKFGCQFALWLTPKATYLASIEHMRWNVQYRSFEKGSYLLDEDTGKKYKIRSWQGLPLSRLINVSSFTGNWVVFLLEFEPLPLTTENISFVEVPGKPFAAWGAHWEGHHFGNLLVKLLRSNHDAVKAVTPKIVR